ncbi:MAG: hypothetical protein A2745_02125 [Candidatus Harrisonbacteria bacterium RIFCSPHIGHO2_01_FULL_44_13]|uniref:Tyrosine recombinase XerC n=1 Tax=Candidatus Harrisonbacteria bacterium RIFCSPLOWO2_01_FULL_44_18 TaxID=1798407 RepID=A0A1G1ZPC5_9BACT|nr:MAG: hypothetical protein A2745_02125 [Candidatus Harrisonbacteria bacterium RIFCSPHIGHO2_01_FULL_44_13]OGY66016.1 MAG: hypothetical protein A3A16_01370 [Candidatus Harrisonbacteria bacterium RIFCSPLOWO2_01_FULL_44_18]
MLQSPKSIIGYIPDFLEYCELEKGLADQSLKNYAHFLRPFQRWLDKESLINLQPHELSPDHIWKYRLFLSRQLKVKKITQVYYLIALRSLLSYFVEKDIKSLPQEKIKLPRTFQERQVNFLNLPDIEKLLLAPNVNKKSGLRDRAILETLFSTGLRVSELTSLNKNQFNFNKIEKEKPDGMELQIVGKGGYPRTIYFSDRALSWLAKFIKTRTDADRSLFINFSKANKGTTRLTPRSVERLVAKYALLAGLSKKVTPHVLRHSYATDLLTQGVDLRLIQEFLGHRNILTTQVYTHVTKKYLKEIHKKYHSGQKLKNS